MVDVRDTDTNNLLFTYGESLNDSNNKVIFREIMSGKTAIRLKTVVVIDQKKRKIKKVIQTNIEILSQTEKAVQPHIFADSRSGRFPAEKIEVLAYLSLINAKNDLKNIYEGYLFGVIPK